MIKEATQSLTDNIKARLSNPFLGAFIICWIFNNWQILFIIFFDSKKWDLDRKITEIYKCYNYWHTLFYPFIWAVVFTIVYPALSYIIFWINAKWESAKKKKQIEINNTECLPLEVSQQLRLEMVEHESKYEKLVMENEKKKNEAVQEKIAAVKELNEKIALHQKQIQEYEESTKHLQDRNTELHKESVGVDNNFKKRGIEIDKLKEQNSMLATVNDELRKDIEIKKQKISEQDKEMINFRERTYQDMFSYHDIRNDFTDKEYENFMNILLGNGGKFFLRVLLHTNEQGEFYGERELNREDFLFENGIITSESKGLKIKLTKKGIRFRELYFAVLLHQN